MPRRIGAVLAGLTAFAMLAFVATLLARASWPAYALAEPTRAYTLNMLLVRQAVGMLCALTAGAIAAWVSWGEKQTIHITGVTMLLIAVIWHVLIWDQYPVWYHLLLFVYLVPLAMLGGRMANQSRRE